jgi:hypothetical protein
MSIAHISRDKSLVLCQHGSQGTPLACSACRRREHRSIEAERCPQAHRPGGGLGPGASGHGPHTRGIIILRRRSAHLHRAPLGTVGDPPVGRARPAPHHAGLAPQRPRSGPHTSGLGGAPPQSVAPCSTCHSGKSGVSIPSTHAGGGREARPAPSTALGHARMRRKPRRRPGTHRCCRTMVGPAGVCPCRSTMSPSLLLSTLTLWLLTSAKKSTNLSAEKVNQAQR